MSVVEGTTVGMYIPRRFYALCACAAFPKLRHSGLLCAQCVKEVKWGTFRTHSGERERL